MAVNKLYKTDETKPKYEVIEYEGKPARLYPDGAIRNENGHFLAQHPAGHTITQADASTLQAKAVLKKRQIMAEAANSAVEDPELLAKYGDYAHVAERAVTLQRIATTPEAGKAAIMAHDALVRDTGMAEKQAEQAQAQGNNDDFMRQLAGFAATLISSVGADMVSYRKHEVIDADVQDADTNDTSTD